jgi:peptide deformylase
MVRPILTYPHPKLREVSKHVTAIDGQLAELAHDLIDTCIAHGGLGLAAVQLGILQRAFVVLHGGVYVFMANPNWEPVEDSPEIEVTEGCLSFPDVWETVTRYERIRASYQDAAGVVHSIQADGVAAQAVQHECEHLNGFLLPDKLDIYHREKFLKKYKATSRQAKHG